MIKYLIVVFILSMFVVADDKKAVPTLTIKKIMTAPDKLIGVLPTAITWTEDSNEIIFRGQEVNGKSLYSIDATSLKTKVVDERPVHGRLNKNKTLKLYTKHGDIFLVDLKKNITTQLTNTIASESNVHFSDDGTKIVFTKNQNVYLLSLNSGAYEQITNFVSGYPTPKKSSPNTASKWLQDQQQELIAKLTPENSSRFSTSNSTYPIKIYTEDHSLQNVRVSPDLNYVIFRLSKTDSKPTMVPNYTTKSGYTENITARSKVGTTVTSSKTGIFDRKNNKLYFVDVQKIPGITEHAKHLKEQKKPRDVIIHGPFWSPQTNDAVVVILSRDNKDRWIMKLQIQDGSLSLLDRQRNEAWIGGPGIGGWGWSAGNIGFIPETSYFWYQSEESGYSHLYICDLRTNEKKQLTTGNFEVYSPKISNDAKYWYFTANKTHPGERHLFRMPIMGGELTQITTMAGNNETYISPDETKIAIRHSYCNRPWEIFIMDNKPRATPRRATFSTTDAFNHYPWRVPEVITFVNRDGKKVYARLYKPQTAKPTPGVIFVHGAGYLQNAHKWWSSYFREYMFHNFLVDHGYTVLDIDYSGSAGYGRDWRTAIYRHMGGKDLTDQVDGAKFLVDHHNVDANNIGIYGGSYGGFITLMAMFKEADVFKAGAALRSVTDWAHYNHPYTSNILNTPNEDAEAYKRSSPIYFAEGLKGALLICHGMLDDNVQFQDVVRLAQRLIELEKDNWELAVYPLERHSFTEPESWRDEYHRIFKLFEENLK